MICIMCGEQFGEGHPGIPTMKGCLCFNCMYTSVEEMCKFNIGGIMPLFLTGCLHQYFRRNKRRSLGMALRQEVLKRYRHKCTYCATSKNLTIDHIKSVHNGGKDDIENLQVLCKSCNSRKGKK